MNRPLVALALALGALTAPPALAAGADPAAAQALFESAMTLMSAGKYTEACPKLEESQRLDPGMGTQFRLAECYEHTGRVARAWALFVEVAEAARREKNDKREQQARKRADDLKSRLPKLTIHVAQAAADIAGLSVTRDGAPLGKTQWDLAVPVDLGAHTLAATAPGRRAWERSIDAAEGASLEVTVPVLDPAPAGAQASPSGPSAPLDEPASGRAIGQRVGAVSAGVVGVGGIVMGSIFGPKAGATWSEALTHCGGDPTRCGQKGLDLGRSASTYATLSTVGFVAGGALLVGGVVLWLTAPSAKKAAPRASMWIAPLGGPGSAGAAAFGRF